VKHVEIANFLHVRNFEMISRDDEAGRLCREDPNIAGQFLDKHYFHSTFESGNDLNFQQKIRKPNLLEILFGVSASIPVAYSGGENETLELR
jgi:hypothetical protein